MILYEKCKEICSKPMVILIFLFFTTNIFINENVASP